MTRYTGIKKATFISIGSYYRVKDAVIFAAKFEWNNYAIGFSYDLNISKLKIASSARGGFEICFRPVLTSIVKPFQRQFSSVF